MELYTINYIKQHPLIYNYLRVDSSWYKKLIKDKNCLKELEDTAKKYYKETPTDKIEQMSKNISLLKTFIDVLK